MLIIVQTKAKETVQSAQLVETKQENKMQHEVSSSLWRFLICLFLTVPVVVTAFLLPISPVSDDAINTPVINGKLPCIRIARSNTFQDSP